MGWSGRGHREVSAGVALVCAVALQTGCKEESQPLAPLTLPARPFLSEAEFTQTPTLAARPNQVVVLDLEPTAAGQATAEDVSRYELEAGDFRFCIDSDDPYLQHLSLETADGRTVVDLDASAGCRDVQVGGGTYALRLRHTGITGPHRLGFLRRLDANPPLVFANGSVAGGWWALAPDDPTGKGRAGRLRALPPPRAYQGSPAYPAVEQIIADFSSQQIDDDALFDFSHLGGGGIFDETGPMIRGGPSPPSRLDLTIVLVNEPSPALIASSDGGSGSWFVEEALRIADVGSGKVQLQAAGFIQPYVGMFIDPDGGVYWDNKPPQLPYMNTGVLFRIYFPGDPDYGQAAPREGEVALYQQCNFAGPATIVAGNNPDLQGLSSPSVRIDQVASVKVGPHTGVLLFSGPDYGGDRATAILGDDPCVENGSYFPGGSFQVRPLLQIFIASSSCPGCDLSGLDLTGVSVSGAQLGAANLSGATLNHTSLHAAKNLAFTNFNGARISCSDFSGTDGGLVDLTSTLLSAAQFDPDISSCRSDFSNTAVDLANLSPAGLRLLDLSGGTLFFSVRPPVGMDLSGAFWPGATVVNGDFPFPGVHFDGATLDGTSLQGIDLRGAILHRASLQGADLTGAMLDQSQLKDAGFQGATLINVTGLQTAASAGADFTGAHFGGVGLVGAVLEDTILDGATFQEGSDLTGIQFNRSSLQNVQLAPGFKLYGAGFVHANLQSSSLAGAKLGSNPDGGAPAFPADFTGAHLKDVDLSNAQLQGTVFANASFYGSFNPISRGPPSFPCVTSPDGGTQCGQGERTGFTCRCATAAGAQMSGTDFSGAFLYGVDFSGQNTKIDGVDFTGAILVGASFDDASILRPRFSGAFLQAANFTGVSLDDASFLNAFLDFEPNGNTMQVELGGAYTGFRGWEAPNQSVCVNLDYSQLVTQVPATTGNTFCPDGNQYAGGCGVDPQPRPNGNPHWESPIAIDQPPTPGYYVKDATYTDANQSAACRESTANRGW